MQQQRETRDVERGTISDFQLINCKWLIIGTCNPCQTNRRARHICDPQIWVQREKYRIREHRDEEVVTRMRQKKESVAWVVSLSSWSHGVYTRSRWARENVSKGKENVYVYLYIIININVFFYINVNVASCDVN